MMDVVTIEQISHNNNNNKANHPAVVSVEQQYQHRRRQQEVEKINPNDCQFTSSLTTEYSNDEKGISGARGVMFTIKPSINMELLTLEFNVHMPAPSDEDRIDRGIKIWFKKGGFTGFVNNPLEWNIIVDTDVLLLLRDEDKGGAMIPLANYPTQALEAQQEYSFYLHFQDPQLLKITNAGDEFSIGEDAESNADMSTFVGAFLKQEGLPFPDAPGGPAKFQGVLHYTTAVQPCQKYVITSTVDLWFAVNSYPTDDYLQKINEAVDGAVPDLMLVHSKLIQYSSNYLLKYISARTFVLVQGKTGRVCPSNYKTCSIVASTLTFSHLPLLEPGTLQVQILSDSETFGKSVKSKVGGDVFYLGEAALVEEDFVFTFKGGNNYEPFNQVQQAFFERITTQFLNRASNSPIYATKVISIRGTNRQRQLLRGQRNLNTIPSEVTATLYSNGLVTKEDLRTHVLQATISHAKTYVGTFLAQQLRPGTIQSNGAEIFAGITGITVGLRPDLSWTDAPTFSPTESDERGGIYADGFELKRNENENIWTYLILGIVCLIIVLIMAFIYYRNYYAKEKQSKTDEGEDSSNDEGKDVNNKEEDSNDKDGNEKDKALQQADGNDQQSSLLDGEAPPQSKKGGSLILEDRPSDGDDDDKNPSSDETLSRKKSDEGWKQRQPPKRGQSNEGKLQKQKSDGRLGAEKQASFRRQPPDSGRSLDNNFPNQRSKRNLGLGSQSSNRNLSSRSLVGSQSSFDSVDRKLPNPRPSAADIPLESQSNNRNKAPGGRRIGLKQPSSRRATSSRSIGARKSAPRRARSNEKLKLQKQKSDGCLGVEKQASFRRQPPDSGRSLDNNFPNQRSKRNLGLGSQPSNRNLSVDRKLPNPRPSAADIPLESQSNNRNKTQDSIGGGDERKDCAGDDSLSSDESSEGIEDITPMTLRQKEDNKSPKEQRAQESYPDESAICEDKNAAADVDEGNFETANPKQEDEHSSSHESDLNNGENDADGVGKKRKTEKKTIKNKKGVKIPAKKTVKKTRSNPNLLRALGHSNEELSPEESSCGLNRDRSVVEEKKTEKNERKGKDKTKSKKKKKMKDSEKLNKSLSDVELEVSNDAKSKLKQQRKERRERMKTAMRQLHVEQE